MSPAPAVTPADTPTPLPTNYIRPLVVVQSYGPSSSPIHPGQTFAVEVNIINTGQLAASNTVVTFFPGDFEPRETGGVRSEGTLQPGETRKIIQTLTAKYDLAAGLGLLDIEIRYTDPEGNAYTEKARLTLDIVKPSAGGVPGPTRTPTVVAVNRPQLVIEDYRTDIEMIQPGATFNLEIDVRNLGSAEARNVSLIVGGGSSGGSSTDGTPGTGGVSGGGADFTNFSPIGSSNVQFLGNVPSGGQISATQALIANATINPGAYSLKMSFVYVNSAGQSFSDDQVITLLVHRPPNLSISFYRPPDPLFVGQPGFLPIQIANLGRNSVVLGMATITSVGGEVMNNTLLVGNIDPGFPITLDAEIIPFEPGMLDVLVTVEYTDDFNQERTLTETLQVEVLEGGPEGGMEGGMEGEMDGGMFPGEPGIQEPETFWQMLLRFLRGLLGLDSARQSPSEGMMPEGNFEEMPPEGYEEVPPPVFEEEPVKVEPAPAP